jgi:phosphoribosylglycinamide formyltransferase-1
VPVLPGDDHLKLAARVLEQEHRLYPKVIRWLAEEKLQLDKERILFDGHQLEKPLQLENNNSV